MGYSNSFYQNGWRLSPAVDRQIYGETPATNDDEEIENAAEAAEGDESTSFSRLVERILKGFVHPEALEVTARTVANGGDNIAVYLPLFVSADPTTIITTLIVFYIMLALWLLTSLVLCYEREECCAVSRSLRRGHSF